MQSKATTIYYGLSIFVLLMVLFVLQPQATPEATALQSNIEQQFNVAWQQTIGDQSYFSNIGEIYYGLAAFYDQTMQSTVALLTQPETDKDIIYVFHTVYTDFAQFFNGHVENVVAATPRLLNESVVGEESNPAPSLTDQFMSQEALYNIVPLGRIAGVVIDQSQTPANANQPWVTLQDVMTGQKYCLAIYDGEVNKYLGTCKNDYH